MGSGGYSMAGENSAPAKNRGAALNEGTSSKLDEICSAGGWSKGRQPKQLQSAAEQGAGWLLSSSPARSQQASTTGSLSNAEAVVASPVRTVKVHSRMRRAKALGQIESIVLKIREAA
ncbi:hypothetical protein DESUT3_06280 [Desulfuromonas versatilis]|uniref:Uncharacterized protein n=1 Tax=Desulfuromonas versatilis TaxID=2802975 RepID=A0ABM8HSX9_9BACT|nr:hypothetical protein DESUT3_06280 [Desulfuromonas versatilis]